MVSIRILYTPSPFHLFLYLHYLLSSLFSTSTLLPFTSHHCLGSLLFYHTTPAHSIWLIRHPKSLHDTDHTAPTHSIPWSQPHSLHITDHTTPTHFISLITQPPLTSYPLITQPPLTSNHWPHNPHSLHITYHTTPTHFMSLITQPLLTSYHWSHNPHSLHISDHTTPSHFISLTTQAPLTLILRWLCEWSDVKIPKLTN